MEKKIVIRLTPDTVGHFVERASRCDFDIDIANISHGRRYMVDAKSLLGVLGLDFSGNLVVSYNGENEEFESMLTELQPVF
ncbi:MAG: HPr family phosphocarrier protein [Lachnospiraceae bacterium]|nr:HPr family phosphocarrier protein [Lachnospiraceae bacterium]